MIHELKIKALSVNEAWKGRRFKTTKYDSYIREMMLILPKINIPKSPLSLYISFGLSSKLNDIDNGLKPFIDCLVKKYGFDDRDIYFLEAKKQIVEKGKEFIKFSINSTE
jgi:Holliday junction resolvase RusA-like endonuclease